MFGPFKKGKKPISHKEIDALYPNLRSITDYLPVVDYANGRFILDDCVSPGIMFEVDTVPTEVVSEAMQKSIEESIFSALTTAIPQESNPYVLQAYVYDEPTLDEQYEQLEAYIKGRKVERRNEKVTETFLQSMKEHYRNICREGGYFRDSMVSNSLWGGCKRRVVCMLYRRTPFRASSIDTNELDRELEEVYLTISEQIQEAQVKIKRCTDEDYYWFMLGWLNPDRTMQELKEEAPYTTDGVLPGTTDLSTIVTLSQWKSDPEAGAWDIGGYLLKAVPVNALKQVPKPFHITGERPFANKSLALFDRMEKGTRFAITITFKPQDHVKNYLETLVERSKGSSQESNLASDQAKDCLTQIALGDNLYPVSMTVYMVAASKAVLKTKLARLSTTFNVAGLQLTPERHHLAPLNTFLSQLPFNYEPAREKHLVLSRYSFASHITRLLPFYGRSRGTQHPLISGFNRGGEVWSVDPLKDLSENSFMLILGPPGSGKSASLVYILFCLVAVYNARIFVIEKGRSFKMICEKLAELGTTVESLELGKATTISLPPFVDAKLILEEEQKDSDLDMLRQEQRNPKIRSKLEESGEIEEDDDEDDGETRDILGEMELIARMMITGGEAVEEERMRQADRFMIRNAIIQAAESKRDSDEQVLVTDVVFALREIGENPELMEKRRERALEMADSMELFCLGLEGQMFNRPGSPIPEADVVTMEIGPISGEGKEHILTVAFMSLMNKINAVVEREEHSVRPTVVICDEAHLVTTNPLLAPYIIKMVKMWRKLGGWLWLATQNMEDFTDKSKKLLSMFEHWMLLNNGPAQIQQISRFVDLSEEDKEMIARTRKQPGCYTEVVYLSKMVKALFRMIPPPLVLALAQSNKEEKAARRDVMREYGVSSMGAIDIIAKRILEKNETN